MSGAKKIPTWMTILPIRRVPIERGEAVSALSGGLVVYLGEEQIALRMVGWYIKNGRMT